MSINNNKQVYDISKIIKQGKLKNEKFQSIQIKDKTYW